jgi:hypothetical protein
MIKEVKKKISTHVNFPNIQPTQWDQDNLVDHFSKTRPNVLNRDTVTQVLGRAEFQQK